MALIQRDFRKDKPKPLRVHIVCGFTPLEDIARNKCVQPVRSPGVSRANATISFLTGVKIFTIFRKGE
jgi:hypothetical protein